MAITINITVGDQLSEVLDLYDQIKVYRSDTATGTFTEITTADTRIDMNAQDTLYNFTDSSGDGTKYYKTSYFNSSSSSEGSLSGVFQPVVGEQLKKNMRITVTIDKDVKAADGDSLGTDYAFFFYTQFTPLYCSATEIDLDIGSYVSDIPDDTILVNILLASLEADILTFRSDVPDSASSKYYNYVRRMWTCYRTQERLLLNKLSETHTKSKTLADLSVTYDPGAIRDAIQRAVSCKQQFESQLNRKGGKQVPGIVVKGEFDPDRPRFGRGWVSPKAELGKSFPAANQGARYATNPFNPSHTSGRKYAKTFIRGPIKWS